jgi:hypothetical protein
MPVRVNLAALATRQFRSDRLGPLDSIAHPLGQGVYGGEVWRDDVRVGSFAIEVTAGGNGDQIDLDLCAVAAADSGQMQFRGETADGYPLFAVFHCGSGRSGFHVRLGQQDGGGAAFDSRALQQGDYYIVTPIRPGRWSMAGGDGQGASGTLGVRRAQPTGRPRPSACGTMIKAECDGFGPKTAEIVSGDGAVFEIAGNDVIIRIALDERERRATGPRKLGLRRRGRQGSRGPRTKTGKTRPR